MQAVDLHERSVVRRGTTAVGELLLQRFAKGDRIPRHIHNKAYVSFVGHGAYLESGRRGATHCDRFAIVVHPVHDEHSNAFLNDSAVLSLLYDPTWRERQGLRSGAIHATTFKSANIALLFRKILDELQSADPFGPLILEGLALEVVGEMERLNSCSRAGREQAIADEVMKLLDGNRTAAITLDLLEQDLHIGRERIARAFKRATGLTVGEYLRKSRVREAGRLLRETSLPIAEVAVEAGFYDQAHLSRVFKKETNLTPLAFRRRPLTCA